MFYFKERIFRFEVTTHRASLFQVGRRVKHDFTIFFGRFNKVFPTCRPRCSSKTKSDQGDDQENKEIGFIVLWSLTFCSSVLIQPQVRFHEICAQQYLIART